MLNTIIGIDGVCIRLESDLERGIKEESCQAREETFGSNRRKAVVITPYWRLFLHALDDFMLKVLLGAACIDIAIEVGFADVHERKTGTLVSITNF